MDERPRIVVSMPAYNAAPFIGEAIESVLRQTNVDLELVVVDDASTDGTADVAASFAGRGVRLVRNASRKGIGACHNLVLACTRAPLIAHVDADDIVAPGALAKLAAAVGQDARVGQGYCDFHLIDATGAVSPAIIEQWRAFFARHRSPPIDYARDLVVHGMIAGGLRTYRREVFARVGGFDENLPWAVDYEMALRIAEHFTFVHVPEMLYRLRIHDGNVTRRPRAEPWRYWVMRSRLVRRQLKAQRGVLLGRRRLATHRLLLLGLTYAFRDAITRTSTDL